MHRRVVADTSARTGQTRRFLFLYALAWAGGAVAYVPFLTLLFPLRLEALAGGEEVNWLSYLAFAGAIAASIGNILFGWLSDRTQNRRGWIFCGLVASCLLLPMFARLEGFYPLLFLLLAWQFALNMMLGPLAAWAGDFVPDHQKGMLGGLMAFSPAAGALAGAFITLPGLANETERFALVAFAVAAFVLPALLLARPLSFPELTANSVSGNSSEPDLPRGRHAVPRMWLARMLIQISEAALFAFLVFWFRSLDPQFGEDRIAQIFSAVLVASVPLALLAGRWADRQSMPILPLTAASGVAAIGLAIMAFAGSLSFAIGGYVLFGIAASIFLALHSAQTLRVLPRPEHRGRDLGFFNLTNTVPSLIMPWLTLALVPVFGFSALFAVLAALAAVASLLLLSLSRPH